MDSNPKKANTQVPSTQKTRITSYYCLESRILRPMTWNPGVLRKCAQN